MKPKKSLLNRLKKLSMSKRRLSVCGRESKFVDVPFKLSAPCYILCHFASRVCIRKKLPVKA